MFKNLSPSQTSVFSSVILLIFVLIILGILDFNGYWSVPAWMTVLVLCCIFAFSYFINIFFITQYLFRRIKPIYKLIHENKKSTLNAQAFDNAGKDVFHLVSEDVRQWKEEHQRKIENLQTLENYRRDFLGNVSHELKTPIFNIQGYVHTLLDGAKDDPDLCLKYLKRTSKNAERLQAIIEDLEGISRLEQVESVLDLQRFDIKKLTEEVFDDLELYARERHITLSFKDGVAQNHKVIGDQEYIRQALNNLIVNSIKYNKENGTTKVGFYNMSQYLLVEVSDNGLGIEKQHLDHVFDRFYRVDKGRSRDSGGSGLGLAIVKHIIEAHQQTINVRSTPGVGSTFGFTLQLASARD